MKTLHHIHKINDSKQHWQSIYVNLFAFEPASCDNSDVHWASNGCWNLHPKATVLTVHGVKWPKNLFSLYRRKLAIYEGRNAFDGAFSKSSSYNGSNSLIPWFSDCLKSWLWLVSIVLPNLTAFKRIWSWSWSSSNMVCLCTVWVVVTWAAWAGGSELGSKKHEQTQGSGNSLTILKQY